MTDATQAEQAMPDPETAEQAPEPAPPVVPFRPGSDILGALLDDPQWASIPDLAARAAVAPVPVYTTGNEAYEECRTITEAEQSAILQKITVEAWQAECELRQAAA